MLARKPFKLHPVDAPVSSRFGTRTDPVDGTPGTFHNGIDYAAPIGTPARSIGSGRVVAVSEDSRSGRFVIVEGQGPWAAWSWSYSHLSQSYVRVGDNVAEGEHIADTGDTGRVTGPHLHFVVKRGGALVDPSTVLP